MVLIEQVIVFAVFGMRIVIVICIHITNRVNDRKLLIQGGQITIVPVSYTHLDVYKRQYHHHAEFHDEMIKATLNGLDEEQTKVLVKALTNLSTFFRTYGK